MQFLQTYQTMPRLNYILIIGYFFQKQIIVIVISIMFVYNCRSFFQKEVLNINDLYTTDAI